MNSTLNEALDSWEKISFSIKIAVNSLSLLSLVVNCINIVLIGILVKQKKHNSTTILFFHQTFIDILRIFYLFIYFNDIFLKDVYTKYCQIISSCYSVLVMISLISYSALFISESCRYVDLKSSSYKSSCCCIVLSILLIWLVGFILISSFLFIGNAQSISPNLCITNSTPFRDFLINFLWFLVFIFVANVTVFYVKSLRKDLIKSSQYSVNTYRYLTQRRHHLKLSNDTLKRVQILIVIFILFCLNYIPNLILIFVQVFLQIDELMLKLSGFFSTFWLLNPCFNCFLILKFIFIETNTKRESNCQQEESTSFIFIQKNNIQQDTFKLSHRL
jgi:hypothetical protein